MKSGGQGRHRTEDERKHLLSRVLELPEAQQLRLHQALSEALGGRLGKETERAKQARGRYEALEALRAAGVYLALPLGTAPSVEEFKRAVRELKLSPSFRAVYAAFDGSWELATRRYEELPIPKSAAQRAVTRQSRARHQDPLLGLRAWLKDSPEGAALEPGIYRLWAAERNERRTADELRLIESPKRVRGHLGLSWAHALRAARGDVTLERAREEYVEELLSAGEFIPRKTLEKFLCVPDIVNESGFPRSMMWFRGQQQWASADIRAYRAGHRFFGQGARDARSRYMDAQEVADAIKIDRAKLKPLSKRALATGSYLRVPKPAGMTGKNLFWERSEVGRWVRDTEARETEIRIKLLGLGRPLLGVRRKPGKLPKY